MTGPPSINNRPDSDLAALAQEFSPTRPHSESCPAVALHHDDHTVVHVDDGVPFTACTEATPLLASSGRTNEDAVCVAPPLHATGKRVPAFDLLRGLIIVAMSLDHARKYMCSYSLTEEAWDVVLPDYSGSLALFAVRSVTHLAAPGFFFLMGVGAVLLAKSRLEHPTRPWSKPAVVQHGLVRGGILVVLALTLLNDGIMFRGANPSDKDLAGVRMSLGVLFALGVNMALALALIAVTYHWPRRFVVAFLVVLAWAIPAVTEVILLWCRREGKDGYVPSAVWLLMVSITPQTKGFLQVVYPVIPWLAPTLWGVSYGLGTVHVAPQRLPRLNVLLGVLLLACFALIRALDGFGNISTVSVPLTSTFSTRLIALLTIVKYPPSLAFLAATLGLVHLLLAACLHPITAKRLAVDSAPFTSSWAMRSLAHILIAYGQSSLFFYLVHVPLFFFTGIFVKRTMGGVGLLGLMPWWITGLAVLAVLCARYARFKHATLPTSWWRFL
ncbi:hypothetical protein GGF31_005641 [Allomyces arbusculus]|nr:hypothetical protein GGF31_005641 [Allomyces arbusculus]